MAHTPGPWLAEVSKWDEGAYLVQAVGPSRRVLARFDGDGDGYDPVDIADAHLIASAPDLLAAVKAVIDACTSAPPIELVKRLDAAASICATAYAKATDTRMP